MRQPLTIASPIPRGLLFLRPIAQTRNRSLLAELFELLLISALCLAERLIPFHVVARVKWKRALCVPKCTGRRGLYKTETDRRPGRCERRPLEGRVVCRRSRCPTAGLAR